MMIATTAKVREAEVDKLPTQPKDRADGAEPKVLGGLVLARQLGESIMIGDSVMVEVLGLKSNSARLRVLAPRTIAVHRREVYDSIRLAPRPASPTPPVAEGSEPIADATLDRWDGGLVLTRRVGQTIMIGDEVAIDVVEARPGTVRLRVIAPRSVAVHRREVYDAIRASGFRDS